MQLQANPKSHHIETSSVALETAKSPDPNYSSGFEVMGKAIGHTHLVFNVTSPTGHVISSPPAAIQVFDALKLTPKHITLVPTATFQVYTLSYIVEHLPWGDILKQKVYPLVCGATSLPRDNTRFISTL